MFRWRSALMALDWIRAVVQNAVNAALPALLAALISLVSKPQGASKLNEVVAKQQPARQFA